MTIETKPSTVESDVDVAGDPSIHSLGHDVAWKKQGHGGEVASVCKRLLKLLGVIGIIWLCFWVIVSKIALKRGPANFCLTYISYLQCFCIKD